MLDLLSISKNKMNNIKIQNNWLGNTFEDVGEKLLLPSFNLYYMKNIKIIPVGYSEWFNEILVNVDAKITDEGIEIYNQMENKLFYDVLDKLAYDITHYFKYYMNTKIIVSGWSGDLKERKNKI